MEVVKKQACLPRLDLFARLIVESGRWQHRSYAKSI